jgi:putative transposase
MPWKERGQAVKDVAAAAGVSLPTVYKHIDRVAKGQPTRKPRADRGACRCLSADCQTAARAMFGLASNNRKSTATLQRELERQYPEEQISRSTLDKVRAQVLAELAAHDKSYRSILVERPNERWEIDCSIGDFFCVHPKTGQPFRPQLTVVVDSATRSILYARYSVATPYMEIGECLHQAVRKQSTLWPQHGIPEGIIMDNGKVFIGHKLEAALFFLRIAGAWSHPYYPMDKPHVERTIGTIHQMFEQLLPSYTGPNNKGEDHVDPDRDFRELAPGIFQQKAPPHHVLPNIVEANQLLWDWIAGVYNQHKISGSAAYAGGPDMTCLQLWIGGWARLQRQPKTYDAAYLTQAFLPSELRQVSRGRITINGLDYLADELTSYNKRKVEVRFDPHDIREVYVYLQGQPICTALVDSPFLHTAPQELQAWEETKKQRRAQDQAQRQARAEITAHPAAYSDLTAIISEAVAAAPAMLAPDATLEPNPIPGYTEAELAELEGVTIGGLPLSPRAAAR